jgi:flagellar hook protein FlgE
MVSTALYTGLSGLRAHQTYIDVIGNNLANVSTPGFRGSRATFSDLLSFTVRAGSGPGGNFGGTNPLQIGYGAVMSTVDTDLNQGTLQDTGRTLDVALQGRGFFTLTNGLQSFYSRVGSFGIDANRTLVDLRSGLRVVGASGGNINVPVSDTLPARQSTQVSFQGNLPARVGGPLEEIVQSNVVLQAGTAASKTATASGASAPQFDLTAFAGRTVLVSVNGGAQQSVTFPAATFGGGPVNASTVAAAFSLQGLQVTADDTAGTIDFATVRLGTQSVALPTTDLASLTSRTAAYAAGDDITISGTNPDGTVFSDTFVYGTGPGQDGTTLGAMVAFLNGTINTAQATAELSADGHIRLVATNKAEASMSLFIGDASGNTGSNGWPNFEITQDGTGPDTAVTSIEIVDAQGRTHPVTMTFTRSTVDPTIWDLQAQMDASEGTITQSSIGQIRFNDNGSFNVIGGGTNALNFSWAGISSSQAVTINLGSPGQFDGVAQLGNATTVAAVDQDGFGAGTLLNAGFNNNGELVGFYSNGQNQTLDTLRISMFSNEGGLLRSGDTLFVESPNSDDAIATTANSAGAGSVRAGQLENSNVDIAREFVNLIEAQRGFQANSRVITTTDEILAELMNIVR